jgi:hypothetical protein
LRVLTRDGRCKGAIWIRGNGAKIEDVDLVRVFIDAFNAGDIDALIACCDPKAEFHSTFAALGGDVYHGHDGIRKWYRDFEGDMERGASLRCRDALRSW